MRSDLQSVANAFVEILLTNAEARNSYSAASQSHDDAAAANVVNRSLSPVPPIAATDMADLAPLVAAGLAARGGAKSVPASTESEPGDVGGSGASVMGDKPDATGSPKDEVDEADGGGSSINVMRDKEVDEDDEPAE
jgi:hypothetical protein